MSPPRKSQRRPAPATPFVPKQSVPVDETSKRELIFFVADKGMEAMIGTFLGRKDFHHKFGCDRFEFNPKTDIRRAMGHDPALAKNEARAVNLFRREYRRVIVVVDNAYEGSPGPEKIRKKVADQLKESWDHYAVICIDPELENWFWVDAPNVLKQALLWDPKRDARAPREVLEEAGLWETGADKPADPKEAVKWLRRQGYSRAPVDNGNFVRLARNLPSVRRCTDESFQLLRATLAEWFPATGALGTAFEQTGRKQ